MNKEKYETEMEREIYKSMLDMIHNGDIVEDMTDAAARKRILHVKTVLHRMLDANAFLSVGDEQ
tara:strand:- start:479 stop:670 length:192 start_codon:yes stop_codon:yes gene_type:complete